MTTVVAETQKKVYANEDVAVFHDDKLNKAVELLELVASLDEERFDLEYKKLCNILRDILEIKNVIAIVPATENDTGKKVVLAFEFPIEATEDNFYRYEVDEDNRKYILV